MTDSDATLLAHLALHLTDRTEDIAVEALGYILSSSPASRGALRDVIWSLGSEIDPIEQVNTQDSDVEGRRPDLAGLDEHAAERVLIEAKFWAGLTEGQPNAYLDRLIQNDAAGPSALLFVAPDARTETLWAEVRRRAQDKFEFLEMPGRQSAAVGDGQCRLMLTSWTDLLGRMAARSSAAGDSAAELDIRQLRGLAARMDEEAFLPLRSDELGPESPRRMRGLRRLIDDATEGGREAGWVSTKGLNVTSQLHGYGRHLRLCGASAWFGINVDLWAHCGDNPLWLHFYAAKNASAVGLDEIRRALQLPHGVGRVAVDLSSGVTYDVGHVTDWSISVAVDLPLRVEYDAVLDAVVAQLEEIGRTINPRFE